MSSGQHLPTCSLAASGSTIPCRMGSASQVASFVAMTVGWLLASWKGWPSGGSGELQMIYVQTSAFLFAIIVYYHLGLWYIEDEHHNQLRALGAHFKWLEFVIRVAVLVLLALIVGAIGDLFNLGNPIVVVNGAVAFLFLLLLVWDWVVGRGGQKAVADKFERGDFVGFVISSLACAAATETSSVISGLLLLIMGFGIAFYYSRNSDLVITYLGRMLRRDMLK